MSAHKEHVYEVELFSQISKIAVVRARNKQHARLRALGRTDELESEYRVEDSFAVIQGDEWAPIEYVRRRPDSEPTA